MTTAKFFSPFNRESRAEVKIRTHDGEYRVPSDWETVKPRAFYYTTDRQDAIDTARTIWGPQATIYVNGRIASAGTPVVDPRRMTNEDYENLMKAGAHEDRLAVINLLQQSLVDAMEDDSSLVTKVGIVEDRRTLGFVVETGEGDYAMVTIARCPYAHLPAGTRFKND